jgi:hypothetical protein
LTGGGHGVMLQHDGRQFPLMPRIDLTDEEYAAVTSRAAQADQRGQVPLGATVEAAQSALAKLDPPKPKPPPKPPIAGASEASIRRRKRQGRALP